MPFFVFLTEEYIQGRGVAGEDRDEIPYQDFIHWYPKFRYQKQAIENLLQTGPAVCKAEGQKSIQAHMNYCFYFKWGGNPATMENIFDPNSQPTYPVPNLEQAANEINDPTTSITDYIYTWDTRRNFLTKRAEKRIKQYKTDEIPLFTDGVQHQQQLNPGLQTQTQKEKATTEEKEKTLQQQLQLIHQYNNQLRQRLLKLTLLTKDL